MEITELRQTLEAARNTFEYRLEKVLFEVAEQTCKLVESQGITRSELAQRLAVTPAYITKLLNGNPNLTIESLLKLSDALGQTLDIRFAPKLEVAQSTTTSFVSSLSCHSVLEYAMTGTLTHLAANLSSAMTIDLASGLSPTTAQGYAVIRAPAHLAMEQPSEVHNNELALAA